MWPDTVLRWRMTETMSALNSNNTLPRWTETKIFFSYCLELQYRRLKKCGYSAQLFSFECHYELNIRLKCTNSSLSWCFLYVLFLSFIFDKQCGYFILDSVSHFVAWSPQFIMIYVSHFSFHLSFLQSIHVTQFFLGWTNWNWCGLSPFLLQKEPLATLLLFDGLSTSIRARLKCLLYSELCFIHIFWYFHVLRGILGLIIIASMSIFNWHYPPQTYWYWWYWLTGQ